jgi:hypothetical protein
MFARKKAEELNLSFTSNQAVVARNVFNALAAAESQS